MAGIATLDDVLRIENSAEASPQFGGSYEILANSSIKHKDKPALSFFLETESYKTPKTWTYGELFEEVNRTANFFNSLGATKDSVIAFVLPNLPQTHWVIWGGEATGIVFAVNPLLESSAIAELLKAAGTEIVVTLAPFPGSDLWQKVAASLD
ncbi:MAG: AMP-binding protein, partial [Gammaproteobacteria bacterium]|nr:AMP-binding protein [Gammaproteobacteria bacterium]